MHSVLSISRQACETAGREGKGITKLAITLVLFFFRKDLCRRGDALRRLRLRALAEAVLEAARHVSHVAHAARAVRAPPQRFLGPVKPAHLGARVAARGAHLLLQVEGDLAASPAGRVRLRVPLSERRGTFRLRGARGVRRLRAGARAGPQRWRVAAAGAAESREAAGGPFLARAPPL